MEKVKVMVVDDSRISRMMIASMLAKTNFEVCAMAENGAEAVELYREARPDVVTMDMNLPDADGIEVSRRIHVIDPQCKIVMISAMKDAKLMMQGRLAGISSFLQKPVSTNELIDILLMLCQDSVGAVSIFRESYVPSFVKVFQDGLAQLLGLKSEISITHEEDSILHIEGVAVIIGITGSPKGRIAVYMSTETMRRFAKTMLQLSGDNGEVSDEEAEATVEECSNIIAGRGVSKLNDVFRDREMRVTPPGTISGSDIRIANPELISFDIKATTKLGDICMNVGFSRGV